MLSREYAGATLCRLVVGLGTPVLMAGIGCGAPTPRWIVPERANIELTIQVMDLDPFVVTDCERLVAAALQRHGFRAPDAAAAKATSPLNLHVDVTFPDGITADITGAVDISVPPQKVLASSGVGYFDLPAADLRSRGGRYRTQACSVAAERFAVALVDRLGNAPHLAVPIPEGTPPMPSEPAHEEESP